jgi:hypothetical protein
MRADVLEYHAQVALARDRRRVSFSCVRSEVLWR